MLPKTVGPLGLLLAAVACSSHRAPASVDGTELRIIAPWAPWSETALVRAGSTIRPPTLARGFAVELPTGAHRAVRLTVNGGAMQIVPEGVRETSAQIVGNAAYYRSAQAGTDVVYVATAGTFEDLRIVRHSTATVSAAYEIRTDGGIADLRVRGDRVFAFDRDGNVALSTGSIFVADARGERRTADVRLVRGDSAWRLEISASTAGMQAPIVLDPSWSAVASLDYEHIDCRVVELPSGGAVVVSGKNTGLAKYEVYDPVANTWTSGNLLFSRLGAPAVGLTGGKVLVPGGFTYVGTTYDSSTEIIDTSAKTTTAAASMKTGRGYHTATKLKSGKVLVVAGEHSETPYLGLSTAELYDPATDTWVDAGALPTTRQGHVAVLLDSGKVLVAGGGGAISYKDAFIYEPITGSWTPVTSMKADHTNGAGILLPSGKVLVVGYSNTGSSEAELYDPTTDSWSTAGVTKANRSSFSAAITPAGKVLVMGGFVFGPGDVSTVEIFDPTTLTWSDGPSMLQKHSNTGAAWLSTGKLLVPAGSAGYATFAEVYDPAKTCTLSTECAVGEHCEAGLCKPKLTVGKACVGPADCVSAFCVDGVCCDKACVGPCEACSAMAKGAGADGTCGN
ncbi:MAG: kelch repeat-containing protein, partial [Ilumatobacteraceae bacterium]